MKLALIAMGLLGLGIAGMAIKMFFNKGHLEKSCASASRIFAEEDDATCQFCGATSEDQCKNEEIPAVLP